MEADLGQCRSEEVGSGEAPNDLAFGTGSDPCHEQGSRSPIHGSCSAPGEFVQRPIGQPATWKVGVNLGNPERQDRFTPGGRTFETLDALSKVGNNPVCARLSHS